MFNIKTSSQDPRIVTFRHFSRGGWAVFASLHRIVRIGVLAVGMLGSVCIEKVEARSASMPSEDEEADEHDLSEVTVAGSMAPLTLLQSARIVGVMTRQDIEQAAAQTVNDLLKTAVGVDVRQRGGFGIQTDISIDGGTFDQIVILLNGLNISNPHTGHLAADFPVSLSDIERIEVLEGAASRVYGAAAFGGAINIVTKKTPEPSQPPSSHYSSFIIRPSSFSFDGGLMAGSYGTLGADARIAIQQEALHTSSSLSATVQRSDGATTNSDFLRGNIYWQGQAETTSLRVQWQTGWSGKSYGANTFYSAAYPNQHESGNRFIGNVAVETRGRLHLRPEVYWQRATDHFQLIRNSAQGENFHRTDVYGTRATLDFNWAAGRTAFATEVREEHILSSNLGRPLGVQRGDHYTHDDGRTNISLSAEHNLLLPRLTASLGLLAHMSSYLNGRFHLYPGIDLAYTAGGGWRLYASYNKGFRLPTFTDLYYKAPTHEGNVGLRPEVSHSVQVGATYRNRWLQATAKTFWHHGNEMIDWVMYSADDTFHSANFDLDNLGFSANARLSLATLLHPWSNDTAPWLRELTIGYTWMHQHRRDDVPIYKSNYAMEYLRHKFVCTLSHRMVSHLTAAWSLRWQDRCGGYILYENAHSTGRQVPYSPYATLDLKLRWAQTGYELWAEATNLTNHTYYDVGNVPQPGLMVMAGARVHF